MKIVETVLGYIPIVLILAGAVLYFLPATWAELPIASSTLGTALFALAVVLVYGGWYDRFDTESDTTVDGTEFDDPVQTTGYLAMVRDYSFAILISIGAVLTWGQTRNPDRWTLVDRPVLELPWGEQPVLGFGFILAGVVLFAFTHLTRPLSNDD